MARLFLLAVLLAAIVVMVLMLTSAFTTAAEAGRDLLRTATGSEKRGTMAPTSLQKIAYVALIIVLFGVASGWLGGL